MTENEIATIIVDAAFKIQKRLGPGLLESLYETTLAYEIAKRGLQLRSKQSMPVVYEDVRMDFGFRADLIVEGNVIVEIKSIDNCSCPSKTALDLLAAFRQEARFTYQLQCRVD